MPKPPALALIVMALVTGCAIARPGVAATPDRDPTQHIVDRVIRPLMKKDAIPGMAVGIIVGGRPRVFNYGYASLQPRRPVTDATLFELGSVSKTFTATLAAWAQARHRLGLSDDAATYLPAVKHTPFGKVTLLELGTHTTGGFPLQVPDAVTNDRQLVAYLKAWHPARAPGTDRTYSNISAGMLGRLTARAMGRPFTALMQHQLLPALGMRHSYLRIPARRMRDYAQGYTQRGRPIRMTHAELSAEAYGLTSTATDMLAFLQANMGLRHVPATLRQAFATTHTAYFRAGPLTQDLIWEQYPYPVALPTLLRGNGPTMIFQSAPAARITPPRPPNGRVWINKTGSTNGFGAYVAFVPAKRLGIVILANKSIPISDRVTAAYRILSTLDRPAH